MKCSSIALPCNAERCALPWGGELLFNLLRGSVEAFLIILQEGLTPLWGVDYAIALDRRVTPFGHSKFRPALRQFVRCHFYLRIVDPRGFLFHKTRHLRAELRESVTFHGAVVGGHPRNSAEALACDIVGAGEPSAVGGHPRNSAEALACDIVGAGELCHFC